MTSIKGETRYEKMNARDSPHLEICPPPRRFAYENDIPRDLPTSLETYPGDLSPYPSAQYEKKWHKCSLLLHGNITDT